VIVQDITPVFCGLPEPIRAWLLVSGC